MIKCILLFHGTPEFDSSTTLVRLVANWFDFCQLGILLVTGLLRSIGNIISRNLVALSPKNLWLQTLTEGKSRLFKATDVSTFLNEMFLRNFTTTTIFISVKFTF